MTADPIGFSSGSINWYVYVGNNPINHIDPLGLSEKDEGPSFTNWVLNKITGGAWGYDKKVDVVAKGFTEKAITEVGDQVSSFTPGVNDVRDVKEFVTGKDAFSGDELDFKGRMLSGLGIVIGSGSAFRKGDELIKSADDVAETGTDLASQGSRKVEASPENLKEGDVMKHKDYLKKRQKGSTLRGHHIPQQQRLIEQGIDPAEGTVVVIENKLNVGKMKLGHTGTRTFGGKGAKTAKMEKGKPLSFSEKLDLQDAPMKRLGKEVQEKVKDFNRTNYPDLYQDL